MTKHDAELEWNNCHRVRIESSPTRHKDTQTQRYLFRRDCLSPEPILSTNQKNRSRDISDVGTEFVDVVEDFHTPTRQSQ